jgi:hypothetical protein
MKTQIFFASALLGAALATATAAQAGTVVCADGTIYNLSGDEITYEVACSEHGGLSPTQLPGANEVQTNTPAIFPTRPRHVQVALDILGTDTGASGGESSGDAGRGSDESETDRSDPPR